LSLSKHGLIPTNLSSRLEKETPNFYKWAQAISKNASVLEIYDEDAIVQGTKNKRAQLRAQG
jgi:glutathione S-transferase